MFEASDKIGIWETRICHLENVGILTPDDLLGETGGFETLCDEMCKCLEDARDSVS